MKHPACVSFVGPAGSGKTPVASFLSWNLGIGLFNADSIRSSVRENYLIESIDPPEYITERDNQIKSLLRAKKNVILDASLDRTWVKTKEDFAANSYTIFLISFDISDELLRRIFKAKGYTADNLIPKWQKEHNEFLDQFGSAINLSIHDENYSARNELALSRVSSWLSREPETK
jgi:cytidylate kinase